jgi:hypothetical protein
VVEEIGNEDIPTPVELEDVLFIGELGGGRRTSVTGESAALIGSQRAGHCANQTIASEVPDRAKVGEEDISVGAGFDADGRHAGLERRNAFVVEALDWLHAEARHSHDAAGRIDLANAIGASWLNLEDVSGLVEAEISDVLENGRQSRASPVTDRGGPDSGGRGQHAGQRIDAAYPLRGSLAHENISVGRHRDLDRDHRRIPRQVAVRRQSHGSGAGDTGEQAAGFYSPDARVFSEQEPVLRVNGNASDEDVDLSCNDSVKWRQSASSSDCADEAVQPDASHSVVGRVQDVEVSSRIKGQGPAGSSGKEVEGGTCCRAAVAGKIRGAVPGKGRNDPGGVDLAYPLVARVEDIHVSLGVHRDGTHGSV